MRIVIKVKVRSSKNGLVQNTDGTYTAFLKSAPVEGKANEELIKLLSENFNITKSSLKIIKGLRSKSKIVDIPN